MKEINYLLVAFEKVKDIFPYARVLKDGRAILQLADIRCLKGVTGIEVIGGHELDILIAQEGTIESEPVDVGNQESTAVESSPDESNGVEQPEASEEDPEDNEDEGDGDEPADVDDDEGEHPEEGQDNEAADASEESDNEHEEPESGGKENEE